MQAANTVVTDYAFVSVTAFMTLGLALLAAAAFWRNPERVVEAPAAWEQRRFGYVVYALIFLSFDMEMIFMYPWAVVFADLGISACIDMAIFIALLSAGIAYTWGMEGLRWE